MHHNINTMCAGLTSPLTGSHRNNTEPEQQQSSQKLMKMQESLMIAFGVFLGCLVHPFGVFT